MNFLYLDLATKLIAVFGGVVALFLSVPVGLKAWAELAHVRRGQRRAEYEFAHQLARNSEDSELQRYARELGYAALIGDQHLQHEQRTALLSLPDAKSKSDMYISVRDLLTVTVDPPGFEWKRPRHAKPLYRTALRCAWFVAYLLACLLAFLPWLGWEFTSPKSPMSVSALTHQVITAIGFLPLAVWSLVVSVRLKDAEKLMRQSSPLLNKSGSTKSIIRTQGKHCEPVP